MQALPSSNANRGRALSAGMPAAGWLARAAGRGLLRLLAVLVPFLTLLLVALLPLTTAVPAWLWAPLGLADLALFVVLVRGQWRPRAITAAIAGALLIALLAVVASQALAATPPITDAQGRPLPNSIAVLEKVNLNGSEQWITIRGHDVNKPVLLYLGMGGPGGGGFATRSLFEPLEEHFVVVAWDEPGTGKSYNAVPIETLTPERFVADAHTLTELLRALPPGQALCLRRLVDEHPGRVAGAAVSRAVPCLHRQWADGQHDRERRAGL